MTSPRMTSSGAGRNELQHCPLCQAYVGQNEGFVCPKCRRGPLCKTHRFPGQRECSGCVLEMRTEELAALRRQEQSIRSFLRLLQFVFLIFSILFIAAKLGIAETVDFLRDNVVMDHTVFFLGLSVAGYVMFYGILYYQRSRISSLDQKTRSEFRRFI